MWLNVLLVLGVLACGYMVWLRGRDLARDAYYGTGSTEWTWFCIGSVAAWGTIGALCLRGLWL